MTPSIFAAACITLLMSCVTSLISAHSYPGTYEMNQQQPMETGSSHHHAHQGGFNDPKVDIDADHIKEHLEGVADMPEDMSQEELEFHYFKLHDFDNNTMLDGLEIFKALTHLLPYDEIEDDDKMKIQTEGKSPEEIGEAKKQAAEKYYSNIVDQVLQEDDIDNDGYLTYLEYVLARRREEMKERQFKRNQKQQMNHKDSL